MVIRSREASWTGVAYSQGEKHGNPKQRSCSHHHFVAGIRRADTLPAQAALQALSALRLWRDGTPAREVLLLEAHRADARLLIKEPAPVALKLQECDTVLAFLLFDNTDYIARADDVPGL